MSNYIMPHMPGAFATHELDCICYTELVKVFRLRRPGTRNMSVQLAFTPEGIHISGDLSLGRDQSGLGNVVDRKPLGWFANPELGKSQSYLCEKFMFRQFQQEAAVEDALDRATEYVKMSKDSDFDQAERSQYSDLAREWLELHHRLDGCGGDFEAQRCVNEAYDEMDDSDSFEGFGMDYPRADAGWLCVVQQKFAELFEHWHPPPTPEE